MLNDTVNLFTIRARCVRRTDRFKSAEARRTIEIGYWLRRSSGCMTSAVQAPAGSLSKRWVQRIEIRCAGNFRNRIPAAPGFRRPGGSPRTTSDGEFVDLNIYSSGALKKKRRSPQSPFPQSDNPSCRHILPSATVRDNPLPPISFMDAISCAGVACRQFLQNRLNCV